jgi:hypothetical protein
MKGLRIELGGKALYILAGNNSFGAPEAHTYCKIFKPFDHGTSPIEAASFLLFRETSDACPRIRLCINRTGSKAFGAINDDLLPMPAARRIAADIAKLPELLCR